jgi:hypothetical protein
VRSEQSKYEAIQRQRASVLNRYKRAYQEFLELESGLQSAKRWYTEMKETVDTFVNNRRAEGAQLLNQIEQEKASNKSAQAEVERERLRGLMERMSMEPTSPPPQPGSTRPVPAPLSFNNTPNYPQTNFAGQYNIPKSPPPNQAGHPGYSSTPANTSYTPNPQQPFSSMPAQAQYGQQAAYNPSSWGRNPGPTSPPATQTSFGIPRGPTSPPPMQTSFLQNQYSTYGNPQAQQPQQPQQPQQQPQQHYVPPGFVPPPPPPGPPPLGPQQTYHYNNHMQQGQEYPYAANQPQNPGARSTQPPHQQQSQDPWAGLSAWK